MQYKFRYIDGIKTPPKLPMLGGTAIHASNEQYYQDVLDGCRERMTPEMIGELSQVLLEENAKEQDVSLEGEEKDIAMQEVKLASTAYIEHIGQFVEPIAVEQEIKYISRCGVPMLGYIDLIREPNKFETALVANPLEAVIVDYKFTGKKMNPNQVKNSLQFILYALSTDIYNVEVQNIVRTNNPVKVLPEKETPIDPVQDKTSNLRLLRHQFVPAEFDHVENLIEAAATVITAGNFMPGAMDSWCCNPTWCDYWDICRGRGLGTTTIMDMAVNR
jgi:hypothetical protein